MTKIPLLGYLWIPIILVLANHNINIASANVIGGYVFGMYAGSPNEPHFITDWGGECDPINNNMPCGHPTDQAVLECILAKTDKTSFSNTLIANPTGDFTRLSELGTVIYEEVGYYAYLECDDGIISPDPDDGDNTTPNAPQDSTPNNKTSKQPECTALIRDLDQIKPQGSMIIEMYGYFYFAAALGDMNQTEFYILYNIETDSEGKIVRADIDCGHKGTFNGDSGQFVLHLPDGSYIVILNFDFYSLNIVEIFNP